MSALQDPRPASDRRLIVAARGRLQGSFVQDFAARLKALDFVTWIVVFGASLMFSVLPLIILLSALADHRVDVDVTRHLGLNSQGAQIIRGLFHYSPTRPLSSIITAIIIGFAGTLVVAGSLQTLYERVFEQEHRGWRDVGRFVVWIIILGCALTVEAILDGPVRTNAGPLVRSLLSLVGAMLFFAWTMHFLLAGRMPWRRLLRPAVATALAWLGLGVFSSIYFSSTIVSDTKIYGTIGAVFTLLTWFIAIGAIIFLGAVAGATWQGRRHRPKAS